MIRDMRDLVPEPIIPLYAWLGKKHWLKVADQGGEQFLVDREAFARVCAEAPHRIEAAILLGSMQTALDYVSQYPLHVLFADGPKVFRPTMSQCEALENTELRIGAKDYRQPYRALLVELPDAFREKLGARWGFEAPHAVLNFHDPEDVCGIITTSMWKVDLLKRENWNTVCWIIKLTSPSIEADLCKSETEDVEYKLASLCQRIAMNACMLLSHFGAKHEPLNQAEFESNRKLMQKASKPETRERAAARARADLRLVTFTSEVAFYEERTAAPREHQGGTHQSPRPHWRRGHWRRQRFGEGRAESRLQFIRPVFVRAEAFAGDTAQTTTIYRGQ